MKKIKLTTEDMESMVEEFRSALFGKKVFPNNFTYTVAINASEKLEKEKRPKIIFSDIAEQKMRALVDVCSDEIGWYGITHRDGIMFYIDDILVVPQKVTGATVNTGDYEFLIWHDGLTDEQLTHCRYYGHSHVNMSTSPSKTDKDFQDDLMQNIPDFHIFSIENKRGEEWWNIFDVESNVLYEAADIDVFHPGNDMRAWAQAMIDTLVERPSGKTWNYSGWNQGYQWKDSGNTTSSTAKDYMDAYKKLAKMKQKLVEKCPEWAEDFLANYSWDEMKQFLDSEQKKTTTAVVCVKEEKVDEGKKQENAEMSDEEFEDPSWCRNMTEYNDDTNLGYDWLKDPVERAQGTYEDKLGVERYIANDLPIDIDEMTDEEYCLYSAMYPISAMG